MPEQALACAGRHASLTLLAAFMANVATAGASLFRLPPPPLLLTDTGVILSSGVTLQLHLAGRFQGTSLFQMAWIGSIQFLCLHLGVAMPWDYCRTPRPFMAAGSVLCLAARLWASFSSSLATTILSEGLLFGIGASLVYEPPMRLLRNCHTAEAGLSGLSQAVASSGALFGALLWSALTKVFSHHAGIDWAYRGMAVISVVFLATSCALTSGNRRGGQAAEPATDQGAREDDSSPVREAFSLVALLFIYAGMSSMAMFVAVWAVDHGLGQTASIYTQMGFFGTGLAGHVMLAVMEGQVNRKYLLLATGAVSGVLLALFPLMVERLVAVFYFALLGLLPGTVLARPPDDYIKHTLRGRRELAGQIASCLGLLLGGPLCGAVEDATGRGWVGGSLVGMATLSIGSLALAIAFQCH